jgi:hypothetical protein
MLRENRLVLKHTSQPSRGARLLGCEIGRDDDSDDEHEGNERQEEPLLDVAAGHRGEESSRAVGDAGKLVYLFCNYNNGTLEVL